MQATAAHGQANGEVPSRDGCAEAHEMRACSGCAGDYEDPDRTAWAPEDAPDDADEQKHDVVLDTPAEEVPAEQR